jgi:hypothetical protein
MNLLTQILIVAYFQDKYMNGAYGMSFTAQLNLVPEKYKAMFTRCYNAHEHLYYSMCS